MATLTHSTLDLPTPDSTAKLRGWRLWWQWTVAVAIGELLDFSVPSLAGGLASLVGIPDLAFYFVLVIAGAGEGLVLGVAQWLVLRKLFPTLPWQAWALPTMAAAVLAWLIGMVPSTFLDLYNTPAALLISGGLVLGILFLLSMGLAQWWTLRHYLPNAGWWVLANAIAWPAGVAMPFVTLGAVPDNSPAALMIVAGVLGGILMGVVVGALTGLALVWLNQAAAKQ